MGILGVDLDKFTFDADNNFYENDLMLLFISDFWFGVINSKNDKHLKKDR